MNYLNQTKIVIEKGGAKGYLGDRFFETRNNDNTNDKYIVADDINTNNDNGAGKGGTIGIGRSKVIDVNNPSYSTNFNPNDEYSRFFMGGQVWDGNNWDNSIVANVDSQDEFLSDDLDSSNFNAKNAGKALKNSVKNTVTNKIGVVKDVKKIAGRLMGSEAKTEVPEGTVADDKFAYLKALKSEKYRNVKLNAVNGGTYNTLANLLGFASGMLVGSLGKSSLASTVDGITSKFTGGLGITSMLDRAGTALESLPTVEEIAALNLIRFETMYEAKPGRIVRDRYRKYNFITPNTVDGIDGSKKDSDSKLNNVLNKASAIAGKVKGAMNTASSWLNGSKFTQFVASKDLNKNSRISAAEGEKIIITVQRDSEYAAYVGSNATLKSNSIDTGTSVRVGYNITDWTGIEYDGNYGLLGKNPEIKDLDDKDTIKDKSKWTRKDVFDRINTEYRKIGCLYIEPYYSSGNINCFQIPFEFNPTINDGGYEAKYQMQELLGRVLGVRSYIGTDSQTVTIETTYLALSDGNASTKDASMDWMTPWTVSALENIEKLYRSLVMPYINIDEKIFVRPPIVRIKLRGYNGKELTNNGNYNSENDENIEYVGDLFKYPVEANSDDNLLYVTKNLENLKTREKRYIVTNLQISSLEDESLSYRYYTESNAYNKVNTPTKLQRKGWRRNGFKVSITLAETTRNFLDIIPTFKEYCNETVAANFNDDEEHKSKDVPNENKIADSGSIDLEGKINNLKEYDNDYFDKTISDDASDNTNSTNSNGGTESEVLAFLYTYGNKKKLKIYG